MRDRLTCADGGMSRVVRVLGIGVRMFMVEVLGGEMLGGDGWV